MPGVPLAPQMPFDRAVFGQWRCYWPFGGGMFTDLFVHQTTHMIAAMGVRYPARVVGGGGIYLEYDGRDVPDVATIVADYDEGCQLIITATMINDHPIEEVHPRPPGDDALRHKQPRRRTAARRPSTASRCCRSTPRNRPACTASRRQRQRPVHRRRHLAKATRPRPLWENFLDCVPRPQPRDAQHAGTGRRRVHHGEHGRAELPHGPGAVLGQGAPPDGARRRSWADRAGNAAATNAASPNQIIGWQGGNRGSTLEPPEYSGWPGRG